MSKRTSASEAVIRQATEDEIDAFFGYADRARLVKYAEVLIEGDMMLAMGSVINEHGVKIVSFDMAEDAKPHALKMIRALRRWLSNSQGRCYAYPSNPALLARLGFVPGEITLNGQELWKWQN